MIKFPRVTLKMPKDSPGFKLIDDPAGQWILDPAHQVEALYDELLEEASSVIATLRDALIGIVGSNNPMELKRMRAALEHLPMKEPDKSLTIAGITALIDTHPYLRCLHGKKGDPGNVTTRKSDRIKG